MCQCSTINKVNKCLGTVGVPPMKVGTLLSREWRCLITFSLSASLIYIVSPLIMQFITF